MTLSRYRRHTAGLVGLLGLLAAPVLAAADLTLLCRVLDISGQVPVLTFQQQVVVRVGASAVTVIPGAGAHRWVYDEGFELNEERLVAYRAVSKQEQGVLHSVQERTTPLRVVINRVSGEASVSYFSHVFAGDGQTLVIAARNHARMQCRTISSDQRVF